MNGIVEILKKYEEVEEKILDVLSEYEFTIEQAQYVLLKTKEDVLKRVIVKKEPLCEGS